MLNLCIDCGNSSTKVGLFNQANLIKLFTFENFSVNDSSTLLKEYKIDSCIISSVVNNSAVIEYLKNNIPYIIELSEKTKLPIENRYSTPGTLGKDRLAAIIGATFLKPETDILVIDAGTAITYDFIDSNLIYWGGNIAPGLNLRLRSLYEFTQKLPLVQPETESNFLGNSTKSAILSGAVYGIVFEIEGYINELKIKYPQLSVFLTGGSTFYFDNKLKSAIFAEKNLVLIGLNRILHYNVQK